MENGGAVAAQGSSGISALMPALSFEAIVYGFIAVLVFRLELHRQAGGERPRLVGSLDCGRYAEGAKRVLRECAPEATLLLSCLTLAAALRARGDVGYVTGPNDDGNDQAWEQIKTEWPLLITADSLLAFQTMLRLVALTSTAWRMRRASSTHAVPPMPLEGGVSVLWLGTFCARAFLHHRTQNYMLDGPLGGWSSVACDTFMILPLLSLSAKALLQAPLTAGVTFASAIAYAHRNRLNLAEEDVLADTTFMAMEVLEMIAAFAYLGRTVVADTGKKDLAAGFTHLLMPLQQALSSYYFLEAFPAVSELVGSGKPFETLQFGHTAAFGAYLAAAALYFAECLDVEQR